MTPRTLNTTGKNAIDEIRGLTCYGPGSWVTLEKTWNEEEGWMKTTKAIEIPGVGCLVNISSFQRSPQGGGQPAEAVVMVPGVKIVGEKGRRFLVDINFNESKAQKAVKADDTNADSGTAEPKPKPKAKAKPKAKKKAAPKNKDR